MVLCLVLAAGALAQSLAVVPLHSDPDQLFKAIRTGARIDAGDCKALALMACIDEGHDSSPTDISLRWVQLDEDPELEAILVAPQSQVSATRHALVFDHGSTWNLVGHFVSSRTSDQETMIRVAATHW